MLHRFFFFFKEPNHIYSGRADSECQERLWGGSRMEGFMHAMISICFLMFCNSFRDFALNQTSAPIHVPSRRKCTGSHAGTQDAGVQNGGKRERQRTVVTLSEKKTSWVDVADYHSRNGSPRPTLRKQNHMCELIYEVLTQGPERISILLGKCFPLGSVSATAYRCFSHAERRQGFSHHGMNEKACLEGFAPAKLGEWSTTYTRVHFAKYCLLRRAKVSSDTDAI